MIFTNAEGYPIEQGQRKRIKDKSAHLFTCIYKFYSPKTKLIYIINADYHEHDVFAIKFYTKQHKHSKNKFSIITNKGDVTNILISCSKVIPILLGGYPNASFGFCASRTIDKLSKKIENFSVNQRFRIYRNFISALFGTKTFQHYEYTQISSYLLINKGNENVETAERNIVKMFSQTYVELPDIE